MVVSSHLALLANLSGKVRKPLFYRYQKRKEPNKAMNVWNLHGKET